MNINHYLLMDKVVIEGANAISSPLTYGFPAISGFMGAIHALNRKLMAHGWKVELSGVLIACHELHVQSYRPHRFADYTFNQSRNPVKKDGGTAAIVEEGKVHLTVSLVAEVSADYDTADELDDSTEHFSKLCRQLLMKQRMAGGSVREIGTVELLSSEQTADIPKRLLPAFVLVDAKNDLLEITKELQEKEPNATELDALIEVATLHHQPVAKTVNSSGWQTSSVKKGRGWLTPMPIGFQAIAPAFAPGNLENSRTNQYPSQYVEAVYSLGKWIFPNRLRTNLLSHYFWRYRQAEHFFLFTQTSINQQGE